MINDQVLTDIRDGYRVTFGEPDHLNSFSPELPPPFKKARTAVRRTRMRG